MVVLFDKKQSIASPTLVPGQHGFARGEPVELTIALVNNMPDGALKATERQFARLLSGAAGQARVHFHCFSLPSVGRSAAARAHIDKEYGDIADLGRLKIDGLIVTGAEPAGCTLPQETLWRELTDMLDWAKTNTRSTIWSCLAAHAAVLHLDGIERHRLPTKCSGILTCAKIADDWLTRGLRGPLKVPHSRLNEVRESDLVNRGYQVLTRSDAAGVDMFAKQFESRFIFFQGHPNMTPCRCSGNICATSPASWPASARIIRPFRPTILTQRLRRSSTPLNGVQRPDATRRWRPNCPG